MEFCVECGTRLKTVKNQANNQTVMMLTCSKCGQKKPDLEIYPKLNNKIIKHNPKQFVAIIGREEQEFTTLPTIRVDCPRCNNNIANVWQVQTRGSDESSTQFLRCTQCNFTYREYT
ncbi:MAG: RPA12/RPB9/RPC11 RNA polymerase family protein [Nitrososphaerota archaeon]|nr:RPA12/RPB9/RPC11 RNA polymerase family protein [Nitrososphaerota archaeon]